MRVPEGGARLMTVLPANLEAERFVLGAVLANQAALVDASSVVAAEDFSLEKHRRIFQRMSELNERGEHVDRVTIANELMKRGELESCDGLTYLCELDSGMPDLPSIGSYAQIVREKALRRRMIHVHQAAIDRCMNSPESAGALLTESESALLSLSDGEASSGLLNPLEIIDRYPDGINAFLDPTKRERGIPTGFSDLDRMTDGLHAGEMFILAARPSMGKTALALNIATHIALHRRRGVAFFSLEMSKESLLTRAICSEARVDSQKFRLGYISADDRRELSAAAGRLSSAPLYIDETSSAGPMEIHARLRKHQQREEIALAVIDYLQLMSVAKKTENRTQEVSALSRGLKLMARDLGIPILVLSQLSRAPEGRAEHRPQLSDLRESGSIEQDADVVAFIYREEVYKPDRADLAGKAELILAKQRNGPTGSVKLVFLRGCTRFESAMDPGQAPEGSDD